MKKLNYLICFTLLLSCNNKTTSISETRATVNPKPVASYIIPMGNPKLERFFGVEVFETPFTYKYLLAMQYDGIMDKDTLYLPQIDVDPKVVVKPGTDSLSCIIGFIDDKKIFREYKMLSGSNGKLKLKTLKAYYVAP